MIMSLIDMFGGTKNIGVFSSPSFLSFLSFFFFLSCVVHVSLCVESCGWPLVAANLDRKIQVTRWARTRSQALQMYGCY